MNGGWQGRTENLMISSFVLPHGCSAEEVFSEEASSEENVDERDEDFLVATPTKKKQKTKGATKKNGPKEKGKGNISRRTIWMEDGGDIMAVKATTTSMLPPPPQKKNKYNNQRKVIIHFGLSVSGKETVKRGTKRKSTKSVEGAQTAKKAASKTTKGRAKGKGKKTKGSGEQEPEDEENSLFGKSVFYSLSLSLRRFLPSGFTSYTGKHLERESGAPTVTVANHTSAPSINESLLAGIVASGSAMGVTVADWVSKYQENASEAMRELLNFILRVTFYIRQNSFIV